MLGKPKVIDLPHSETKLLSPGAANHLEEVLVHLKSQPNFQKPYLVSAIIEPKLEDIFARNKALNQISYVVKMVHGHFGWI